MATRDGTLDDFTYVPTTEEIDTYNEVHNELVDLNLQIMLVGQELKKLVQESRERDEILKKITGEMKEEQESRKRSLQRMLMTFFKSKFIVADNLEGFILEQEVYNLMMSTKIEYGLNLLMTGVGRWFTRPVDISSLTINFWNRIFDRTPKKLVFRECDIFGLSANSAQSSQPQRLRNRCRGAMEMSLSDVVVELYRFSRDMALDIEACVASRTLVSEAFKNDSMSDDLHGNGSGFDPMDYLDHQVLSENCEPEDAETLNWKNATIMREKLENLYPAIVCYEDEQYDGKEFVSGFCVDNIVKVMKAWIFHMESVLWDLIYSLYAMISDCEPAMNKFQKFKSELKHDKEKHNGMEAVIAYKILAMPRISCKGLGFNSDEAVLHKEIGFDNLISSFKKLISHLGFVLRKSSKLLNAQIATHRALIGCLLITNMCEELLQDLGLRIYAAKSRIESCINYKESNLSCPNSNMQGKRKRDVGTEIALA